MNAAASNSGGDFCGDEDRTQALELARQVLYHWATLPHSRNTQLHWEPIYYSTYHSVVIRAFLILEWEFLRREVVQCPFISTDPGPSSVPGSQCVLSKLREGSQFPSSYILLQPHRSAAHQRGWMSMISQNCQPDRNDCWTSQLRKIRYCG